MPDDVAVAVNVAADPPASIDTTTLSEPQSFAEVMQRWTPEQKKAWDETGAEPEEPKPAIPVVDKKPVPDTAEVAPVTGQENEDQEPEYFGTPAQIAQQRHAYAKVVRQRTEARAEARILREQLAERNKTATAAVPPVERKPSEVITARPKRPRITDAKYSVENGGALYDADCDAYEDTLDAFKRQESAREREEQQRTDERQNSGNQWQAELTAARKEDPKFDSIVFNDKFIVSLPMAGVLMSMKGGASAMKYLALNPGEAERLVQLTDISGTFKSYDELVAAADKDPRLARQLGAAEGIVRAAARRIIDGLPPNGKPPDPQPIIVTKAAPPGARVDAAGSPAKDALAQAEENYDRTGEHKYLVQMNKLADERDRERRQRR